MAVTPNYLLPLPERGMVPKEAVDEAIDKITLALGMIDGITHDLSVLVGGKANTSHFHALSQVTGLVDALASKMAASKTFTIAELTDVEGAGAAPSGYVLVKSGAKWQVMSAAAAMGNHQHGVADIIGLSTAIDTALSALVGSAPATLDTLAELATALGNDANFAATMAAALASKSAIGHTHAFADLTSKPTTLLGYGITDGSKANYQEYLVSGTWTKPSGLSQDALVLVEIWGAGGGGGAYGGGGAAGAGGGGGGYNTQIFRASELSATVSVTIGAGGAAGAAGGNTTFGSYLSAYGGGAGGWSSGSTPGGGGGGGGTVSRGGNGGNNTAGAAGAGAGTPTTPVSADTVGKGGGGGGNNANGGSATMYGGGGGAGGTPANGLLSGGHSYFGGGGGAAGFTQNGGMGTSVRGGTGGGVNGVPLAQVPGGGGGANGGSGAAGKCIVRVIG